MISQGVSLFLIQYAFMIINNDGRSIQNIYINGSVTFYIISTHRISNYIITFSKNLWIGNLKNPPICF